MAAGKISCRHRELVGPGVRRALVSEKDARRQIGSVGTRSISNWWRSTRPSTRCRTRLVERMVRCTPNDFVFDVKLHHLLSHHSTPAKLLPPAAAKEIADQRANAKGCDHTRCMDKVMRAFRGPLEIFVVQRSWASLLLQLSPAFSPRKHELNELENRAAIAGDFGRG